MSLKIFELSREPTCKNTSLNNYYLNQCHLRRANITVIENIFMDTIGKTERVYQCMDIFVMYHNVCIKSIFYSLIKHIFVNNFPFTETQKLQTVVNFSLSIFFTLLLFKAQ